MSEETHRVLIGACGWQHQAWLNDFYSDDLPEDWQLGFYSNEFPVVYVPETDWINVDDLSEWMEDVSDSFRFILEISGDILSNQQHFTAAMDKVKVLGDYCLGLVFKCHHDICNDISLFKKNMDMAQAIVPVCVDRQGINATDEFNTFLLKQNISEVWNGVETLDNNLKRGTIALTHITKMNLDMKVLRMIVEGSLSASSEDRISVLCFDGDPPSLETLRNADILLNLL